MTGFDVVWQRIVALQGETFYQKRGQPFRYRVYGNSVMPSTTQRQLGRSQFERAFGRMPVDGPGDLHDLQGPTYLFAILTDPRVAGHGVGASGADPSPERGQRTGGGRVAHEPADVPPSGRAAPRRYAAGDHAAQHTPEGLGAVDPHRVLLVVTCSAGKARGGSPPAPSQAKDWCAPELLEARARVLAAAPSDLGRVMPASRRYTGEFYRSAGIALAEAAAAGNVVILSGGYGIVRADDLIGWYEKIMRPTDWPAGVLEATLIAEARRAGVDSVVAFAARTSGYAHILRRTPWHEACLMACLVTTAGVPSPRTEVPRRLGLAFAAFWSQHDDRYPAGTMVERLS